MAYTPIEEWDGLKVFNFKPVGNIKQTITERFVWVGKIYNNRLTHSFELPRLRFQFDYEQSSYDEREAIKTFFLDRKGKYEPFLCRTFKCDLNVKEDVPTGAVEIKITNQMFKMLYVHNVVDLYVYMEGFQQLYKVVGVIVGSDPVTFETYEVLQLDRPINETMPIKTGDKLELVFKARFDTDVLSFKHYDIDISTCSLSIMTVKDYGEL